MNACIDQEMCNGCELCAKKCPEVFRMEDGKAVIVAGNMPEQCEFSCMQAANTCPAGAIYTGQAKGLMMAVTGSGTRSWIAL